MPPSNPDLLFWTLLLVVAMVAIFVAGFVIIVMVMARRSNGHHPQVSGHQGVNSHDASSHSTTTVTVDKLNVNSPRLPAFEER